MDVSNEDMITRLLGAVGRMLGLERERRAGAVAATRARRTRSGARWPLAREADEAPLREALAARGIELRGAVALGREDEGLLVVADMIAREWREVRGFLLAVARSVGSGRGGAVRAPEGRAGAVWRLASACERAGLLPRAGYERERGHVWFREPRTPLARTFFQGGWLELHAWTVLRRTLPEAPALFRVGIGYGDGRRAELDLCALLPDGGLLWVEAKSGRRYADRLDHYAALARRLCTGSNDAAVLLTSLEDTTDALVRLRGRQAGMEMLALGELEGWLARRAAACRDGLGGAPAGG